VLGLAEGFIKNQFINPFNLAAGTASAFAGLTGNDQSRVHKVAKAGNFVGDALNYHTVWQAANDESLSGSQKAGVIGGTLGGMFSAKAVSGLMEKSRNPWLKMAAPLAGFITNAAVGSHISSWFSADKSTDSEGVAVDKGNIASTPEALSTSQSSALTHAGSLPVNGDTAHQGAQVTVNANITVNARSGEQAQDIAIQVKQILEQQQQQAVHDLNARYFNQVA
jgi:ribosomal 50S subunit-recycling heat shock protein